MPYTIKSQQIAVKDPDTGEYVSVDILAEQTKEGLLSEINILANNKKNEITQLGDSKKQAITQEATTKLGEITSLGDSKKDAITQEATSQLTAIGDLGDSKKDAITQEGSEQVMSVNAKGQEVLASIPSNYMQMANTVEAMVHGGFIYSTNSGNVASFDDGSDGMLIKSLVVNIKPTQDLHGYDAPWPAGCETNKTPLPSLQGYWAGADGTFVSNQKWVATEKIAAKASTTYTLASSYTSRSIAIAQYKIDGSYDESLTTTHTNNYTFTTSADCASIGISIAGGASGAVNITPSAITDLRLTIGSSDVPYKPYKNTCEIVGHTGITISHSGADTSNPETISVNWQSSTGTVYRVSIDVISGELLIISIGKHFSDLTWTKNTNLTYCFDGAGFTGRRKRILSYNNPDCLCDTYPFYNANNPNGLSNDIPYGIGLSTSNNNIYTYVVDNRYSTVEEFTASFTTHDPFFIAPLEEPIRVQLTPQEIECFMGVNNIWADTGDVTVTYPVDTKTYIDKKIQEAIDGLSGS